VAADDLHLEQLTCQNCVSPFEGGHLYDAATELYHAGKRADGLQTQEESPWLEIGLKTVVFKVRQIHGE